MVAVEKFWEWSKEIATKKIKIATRYLDLNKSVAYILKKCDRKSTPEIKKRHQTQKSGRGIKV